MNFRLQSVDTPFYLFIYLFYFLFILLPDREMGMSESLFARLDSPDATVCLDVQYRMNQAITDVANGIAYNGQLKCGNEQVSNATLQLPALHVSDIQNHK
jgi:superfamily I DNA and/or RNA helicase